MRTRLAVYFGIFLLSNLTSALASTSLFQNYFDAMKRLSRNCSMSYSATCYYPNRTESAIAGKLAIRGSDYYDSSNIRFVMKNRSWLVTADHLSQTLNVIYLPAWEKMYGPDMDIDISGFLLSDSRIEDVSDFKVASLGTDSFTVRVQYDAGNGQTLALTLYYRKGDELPGRYVGELTYRMSGDEDSPSSVDDDVLRIAFECRDIRQGANASLFDEERLIKVSGKKAQMKKFNDYKIYKRAI